MPICNMCVCFHIEKKNKGSKENQFFSNESETDSYFYFFFHSLLLRLLARSLYVVQKKKYLMHNLI